LVDHLVHGLVEQHGPKQDRILGRVEAARRRVAGAERLAVAPDPVGRPECEAGRLRMGDELVPGGVVERTQHAGHVPQRGGPGPALGQRAGRLALEVEHDPAGLGPHDLAQVVVAVHPLVAASAQPSEAARRYRDKIASTVLAPSSLVSTQPNGSAMCDEPSSASAEATSRSGFGPGLTRRNTLKMADSPNTRLVLLCSPVSTRLSSPAS